MNWNDAELFLVSEKDIAIQTTATGKGVVAMRPFPEHAVIGEICGKIVKPDEADPEYSFEYSDDSCLEPDAPFRFLNHSCAPNCEVDWWEASRPDEIQIRWRLVLVAVADIGADEQLTIDYRWGAHAAIPCFCGTPECRGWIVDENEIDKIKGIWDEGTLYEPKGEEVMEAANGGPQEARLIRLEETLAHQEQLLENLDAAMTDLRDDLDRVRKQSKLTGAQIDWLLANSGEDRDLPHEKPPHY